MNGNSQEKISVPDQGLNFTLPSVTLARCLDDKVAKILEEGKEVSDEMDSSTGCVDRVRVKELTKEIIDVMVSCQSALNHLNYFGVPVQQMIDAVYEKNNARGYYTPGGIPYVRDEPAQLSG
jgi:NTP pyrophosphatase (non-canonical NTP hydrolase)